MRIFAQAFGRDLKNQYCWSSLTFLSLISLARYIRVRYEDLVDDTDKTLENIYSHIGLPWTEHVRFLHFDFLVFRKFDHLKPNLISIIAFCHNHHLLCGQEGYMVAHSRRKRDRHKWPWLLQHIQVARDHEKEDQMKTYETPFILLLTLAKKGLPYFCDDSEKD